MHKIKKFDDDEFRAKRVFTELDKKQKSSYSFKKNLGAFKNSKPLLKSQISPTKKQTEVVVKLTGSSKNFEALKAHLKYISRNGKLEIINGDENNFYGKEYLDELANSFNENYKIPTQNEIRDNASKEKREVLHFVFSMKDYEQVSTKKIREAAMKTMQSVYPNNYFVVAMHNDTDNPHCHIALKVKDNLGKRINPKKSDLAYLRLNFAKELRNLGIEAKATIGKNKIDFNTNTFQNDKPIFLKDDFSKLAHKSHHYQVISFGKAHYNFNPKNKESFYVRYRTSKGKDIDIFADDLERVVKENGVKVGDYCRFVITDEKPVILKIKYKKSGEIMQKTTYKKIWDVSIENKNEKKLSPIKKSKTKFEILKEQKEQELNLISKETKISKKNQISKERESEILQNKDIE